MRKVTKNDLDRLLEIQQSPCISIYMPTERTYPGRQQGPVRFKNLLDRAESAIQRRYPANNTQPLLTRLRELEADNSFWDQCREGLGILASSTTLDTFALRNPSRERIIVAEWFYLTPLVRVIQSADRFHVLCLQRKEIHLYEGNRDGLERIEPEGVPWTLTDALGDEVTVQRKEQVPAGKSAGEPRPAPRKNGYVGHAAKGDDAKLDEERFFRAIDRAIWEHVSKPSGLPLVLVALPEQQSVFRRVSENPQLWSDGVEHSPAGLSEQQLLNETWKSIEPRYLSRLGQLVENYTRAKLRNQATDDLEDAATAAHNSRVGILLMDADRTHPGQIDSETGKVKFSDDPELGDLFGDLVRLVLLAKGTVVVVPSERMPTGTGLAAIYRF
jgi:hypothetical protein